MLSIAVIAREAGRGLMLTLSDLEHLVRGSGVDVVVALESAAAAARGVAEDFGADVIEAEAGPDGRPEDAASLRNRAAGRCRSDWVLLLEAGERLGPREWLDAELSLDFLVLSPSNTLALLRTTFDGSGDDRRRLESEYVVRGYDRRQTAWVGAGVPHLASPGPAIRCNPLELERDGYGSPERLVEDVQRLGERLIRSPLDLDAAYHVARISSVLSESTATLRWGEWFCSHAAPDDARGGAVHSWMVAAARELGEVRKARELLVRGLQRYPQNPDLNAALITHATYWLSFQADDIAVPTRSGVALSEHLGEAGWRTPDWVGPVLHGPRPEPIGVRSMARTGSWIDTLDERSLRYPDGWQGVLRDETADLIATYLYVDDDLSGFVSSYLQNEFVPPPDQFPLGAYMTHCPLAASGVAIAVGTSDADSEACGIRLDMPGGRVHELQVSISHRTELEARCWASSGVYVAAVFHPDDHRVIDAIAEVACDEMHEGLAMELVLERAAARALHPPSFSSRFAVECYLVLGVEDSAVGFMKTSDRLGRVEATLTDGTPWAAWPLHGHAPFASREQEAR